MGKASFGAGIMVLGMHRSGTSALSHALRLAGADSGARVLPGSRGNEGGHWEDAFAVELHERLLSRFGARWDEPFALPADWRRHEAAVSASASIQRYLVDDRSRHAAWVVKDPRLCLFGDLWREAADAVGIPMSAVVLIRHPQEVADSLATRDGLGRGVALLLWAEHTLSALRVAESLPSVVLGYDELLADWSGCAARIAKLPASATLDFKAAAHAIVDALDAGKRHHVRKGPSDLPACVRGLWEALQEVVARSTIEPGTASRLAPALDEVQGLLQLYAGDMREQRRQLWDRIARSDEASLTQVAQAIPAEIEELRTRINHHHETLTSVFSDELRTTFRELRATETQLRTTETELRTTEAKLGTTEDGLRTTEAELRTTEAELRTTEAKLGTTEAGLRTTEAELRMREQLVQTSESKRIEAERQTAMVRADMERILGSHSWRWSRPLRVLARLLRGQWGPGDTQLLKRSLLGWAARSGLVPKRLKRGPLALALLHAHERTPFSQAIADGAAIRLAAQDDSLPDVFFWSVIDWHFRTQRPQHLAQALAGKGHRVFYISNNFMRDPSPGFSLCPLDAAGRLFQINLNLAGTPQIYSSAPNAAQLEQLQASLATLLQWSATVRATSIVQHPYWSVLATMVPSPRLVYDCMDHHAGFADNGAEILRCETDLVRASDLVVVTSEALRQEVVAEAREVALIRNAADYAFFERRPDTVFEDTRGRRIIGYYGAIAEWFDLDLVRAVAVRHANALIVLIGADTVGAQAALGDLDNVKLVGEMPYVDLPFWVHAFDVCLLPFKRNALTNATNPVKVYEYLAAGKPVVSVDLPEMVQFDGLVDVAADTDAFVAAVGQALEGKEPVAVSADRQAFARGQTWARRADLLDDVLRTLAEPRVSVVVLTYNNLAYTQACLFSIESYSDYSNLELLVVDNASSDGSREWLQEWASQPSAAGHEKRVILNDGNVGFAAGNNVGLRASSGETLVILNNDTYVTPGWVRTLCAHLRRDARLGLVGPITNNIGNEAKVDLDYSSMEEMIAASGQLTRMNPGGEIKIQTAAFFCVAMTRDVFDAVGSLDEAFGVGFFEDDDYCRRVEQAGYRIACAEDVFVHHHLSASFGKLDAGARNDLFERNKAIYEGKWGAWKPHVYRGRDR